MTPIDGIALDLRSAPLLSRRLGAGGQCQLDESFMVL